MICKTITMFLLCFNVGVKTLIGLGNSSLQRIPKWKLASDLEEVFDKKFVALLNSIETLDNNYMINIDDRDVELLSTECYTDESCLEEKAKSITKYHSKVEGIQCVNAVIVERIWDQLNLLIYRKKKKNVDEPVNSYVLGLSRMISVLFMAKRTPHSWQIKTFTFLSGLVSSNRAAYLKEFKKANSEVMFPLLEFIWQCRNYKYLNINTIESSSFNVPDHYLQRLYADHSKFEYAYSRADLFTVENLSLSRLLHGNPDNSRNTDTDVDFDMTDDLGYGDSIVGAGPLAEFDLDWTRVNWELLKQEKLLESRYASHKWQMDPFQHKDYHALIVKCIRLRFTYHAWLHVVVFYAVKSKAVTNDEQSLLRSWSVLEGPLKNAVRFLVFRDCDYFWIVLRAMMDDIDNVDVVQLKFIEGLMRINLVETINDLGLGDKNTVDVDLQNIFTRENYKVNLDGILSDNAKQLQAYTVRLREVFKPLDGTLISMFVKPPAMYTRKKFVV